MIGPRTAIRVMLVLLGVSYLFSGSWARFAPHSFYTDFPGLGRHWVESSPPYNAHLVTDVGGALLAFGVLAIVAAVMAHRLVTIAAMIAWIVFGISHFTYHAATTERLSTGDNVGNLVSLALAFAVPALILWLLRKPTAPA